MKYKEKEFLNDMEKQGLIKAFEFTYELLSESLLSSINHELDDLLLPYLIDLSIQSHIQNPELTKHIERVGKEFYKKTSE